MKGFFSQGVAVLFQRAPTLDVLASVVPSPVLRRIEPASEWALSGPSLVLGYRPEVNGLFSVDVVARPWPDDMGSPEGAPMVFGAWSMGHFGPFAYPGNLERACQQAWTWRESPRAVIDRHRAFVRIRLSYVFGAPQDAPVRPEDCDPANELVALTGVAQAVAGVPGVLAYFNPNGEMLLAPEDLRETVEFATANHRLPIEAWTNVRMLNLRGLADGWMLMDTVGLSQLDRPDLEAVFPEGHFDPGEVARLLRDVSLYVFEKGDVIEECHTIDGPGPMRWQARRFENGLSDPPRDTIRFFPTEGLAAPSQLASRLKS